VAVTPATDNYRFGVFELDTKAGQLTRKGIRTRLAQQPLQVLCILLDRPGEIVTRDELQKLLWSADVFVDFDHGLNKSIQKLREALGDSAESPRFIETIPRIGYRFIAPVIGKAAPLSLPPRDEVVPVTVQAPTGPRSVRQIRSKWKWYALGGCSAIIFVIALWVIEGQRQMIAGSLVTVPWHRPQVPPIRSVAVLRLRSRSPDPSVGYFADGMTEELVTELAAIPELRVISDASTSASPMTGVSTYFSSCGRLNHPRICSFEL
jgi:DNA-binding winged helix-turn-helix (wHTH) protein